MVAEKMQDPKGLEDDRGKEQPNNQWPLGLTPQG
jgi:hypothetical protein